MDDKDRFLVTRVLVNAITQVPRFGFANREEAWRKSLSPLTPAKGRKNGVTYCVNYVFALDCEDAFDFSS